MALNPRFADQKSPLVSVLIFNYNYGRYLRECFESILNQTYDNIEICFSDNSSTDDSWEIAQEYASRHPSVINLARNRQNFGADANFANCFVNARGKYFIEMCSDDAMHPQYIEACVEALEAHPEAGFAMVHRTIIDDDSVPTEEPPFYDQTCKIHGPDQAAVYMMAAVNPAVSQIMYVKAKTYGKNVVGGLAARWYGTRIMDFHMCCDSPMVYIKEPLLLHRLHSRNDSFRAADNMMEVIGPYVLNHQFADMADGYQHHRVRERLPASIEKTARLGLRYSVRALISGEERNALKYFHLAAAFHPEMVEDKVFKRLECYWQSDEARKAQILAELAEENQLVTRTISYAPPVGSIPVRIPSLENAKLLAVSRPECEINQ